MPEDKTNRTVIFGALLIPGTGAAPVENSVITIEGDRIKSVSSVAADEIASVTPDTFALDGKVPALIDAVGKFVMPGLIDGHCHLSLHQGALPGMHFRSSAEFCTLWAARAAGQALDAGVTSISVPGGKWFADVTVRDAINAGLLQGPRVFTAGRALTPYGGIFDTSAEWNGEPADSAAVLCNTPTDYVREVRRQAKHGVDLIKVADSYWGDTQTISLEELKLVVDEAHRRNVRVAIHARGAGSTRDAAIAGVDWIFHADLAGDEDLDVVAEAGTPIMPVLTSVQLSIEYPEKAELSPRNRDRWKQQYETSLNTIVAARSRGIPILIGTDTGNLAAYGHGRYHGFEAEIFVKELGFSPMEAIAANTSLNAQVMGQASELGTIEPGKLADILVLNANPLDDVSTLRRPECIVSVIKGGTVVQRGAEGFRKLEHEPPRARA